MNGQRSSASMDVVATSRDYDSAGAPPDVRCKRCGWRIGVYETMVAVSGGVARRTSRAADPGIDTAEESTTFHTACYDGPTLPLGEARQ
jgi:hypothetical protein